MLALPLCLLLGALYVGLLYVLGSGPRHAPSTIKRRTVAVLLVCGVAWVPAYAIRARSAGPPLLQQFGLSPQAPHAAAAAYALGSVLLLYLAPLVYAALHKPARQALTGRCLGGGPWPATRLLLVGPLAEEWCFRAAMVPCLLMEGYSRAQVLVLVPLLFGVAHAHGILELRAAGVGWSHAMAQVAFQQLYTTVFGSYATWLLLVSGSLAAPVVAHVACNALGVPDFSGLAYHPRWPLLRVLLVAGIVGFLLSVVKAPQVMLVWGVARPPL